MNYSILFLFSMISTFNSFKCDNTVHSQIDVKKSKVWGPGIDPGPEYIIISARYFYIHAADSYGNLLNFSQPHKYSVQIQGESEHGHCRVVINQIDRKDGSVIVRYKNFGVCRNFNINILYDGEHVANSPYKFEKNIYAENCICPEAIQSIDDWMHNLQCPTMDKQIEQDLRPFQSINFTNIRSKIISKFDSPGSISICNYVIRNNEIYRKCYGQYTGFKMFVDSVLLVLSRKMHLPDIEFFANLGDWPLVKKGGQSRTTGPYPVFSWFVEITCFLVRFDNLY